jgi:hypothetical protein
MTFAPKYFASKRWVKVGRQELGSTPYKQGIDPRSQKCNRIATDYMTQKNQGWIS